MIQRIQTFWLLFASACAFAAFKFPFYTGTDEKGVASAKLNASSTPIIMLVTIIIGVLAALIIFLFKKRRLQLWLSILGIVLEALLIFLYYTESTKFLKETGTPALTAILQAGVIFFFFLAASAINRDNKIVKDSERLR